MYFYFCFKITQKVCFSSILMKKHEIFMYLCSLKNLSGKIYAEIPCHPVSCAVPSVGRVAVSAVTYGQQHIEPAC